MTTAKLSSLIGRTLILRDSRTGLEYPALVNDAKESYGRLRIKCQEYGTSTVGSWFEPTTVELESVK